MKHPEREQIDVPRIHEDIKEMNGKSTERLTQCIDKLSDLLDDNDEETTCEPRSLDDAE